MATDEDNTLRPIGRHAKAIGEFLTGEVMLRAVVSAWPDVNEWGVPSEMSADWARRVIVRSMRVYCLHDSVIPPREGLDRIKCRLIQERWGIKVDRGRNVLLVGPRSELASYGKTPEYRLTPLGPPGASDISDVNYNVKGTDTESLMAFAHLLHNKLLAPNTKVFVDAVSEACKTSVTVRFPNVEFVELGEKTVML